MIQIRTINGKMQYRSYGITVNASGSLAFAPQPFKPEWGPWVDVEEAAEPAAPPRGTEEPATEWCDCEASRRYVRIARGTQRAYCEDCGRPIRVKEPATGPADHLYLGGDVKMPNGYAEPATEDTFTPQEGEGGENWCNRCCCRREQCECPADMKTDVSAATEDTERCVWRNPVPGAFDTACGRRYYYTGRPQFEDDDRCDCGLPIQVQESDDEV